MHNTWWKDIREKLKSLQTAFQNNSEMPLEDIHLNIVSPRRWQRQKNISRTNRATLTQQILPGSHELTGDTLSLNWTHQTRWRRRRRAASKGDAGGMDWQKRDEIRDGCGGRLGVERAGWPCIRCINNWSAGGRQTCAHWWVKEEEVKL